MGDDKNLGADAAAVENAEPVASEQLSHAAPTPGPWVIRFDFNVFGGDGRLVASAGGHANNVTPLGTDAENRANAHLIAAAPELLEALKLIVEHFGDPLKVARAAIAKAEGRSR